MDGKEIFVGGSLKMLVFLYARLLALDEKGIANMLAHSDRNLNFTKIRT